MADLTLTDPAWCQHDDPEYDVDLEYDTWRDMQTDISWEDWRSPPPEQEEPDDDIPFSPRIRT